MPTIDDKIVAASFDSKKFEAGVNRTISAIDKLNKSLQFPNAGRGLENINAAAKRVDLSHIGAGVDQVSSKLNAFRLTAIAVFANVASEAIRAGTNFAKSFTVQPIIAGFQEYATNLNAVQTILANTQASGATLKDVNAALLDLNHYSDKTIYNFSQMAKNIGTFTAAGVDLKTATGSIKGIANLAALSGSNADQASTAMYQLSQAISAGQVHLQDWNSVVNAGMGGTVFQRALATTAENMGTIKKGTLKLIGPMKNVSIAGGSFRQSLQAKPGEKSWLTSDVLTKTLQQFTGDLTDAQLKAQGFNDAQIKSIQQTAVTAQHAATQVKTIQQVLDVAKETAGSGWSQTFQTIFGNFGEAKKTFTSLSNTINGFINTNANARNKVLADWKKLGGRAILIDNIKIAFHNLGLIIKPIKDAFRDIFPKKTGRDLLNLTVSFAKLAQALKPSDRTLVNLRNTFQGVFAIFDIGKQVFVGIISLFKSLFKSAGVGGGGILDLTGSVGDMIFNFDKALKKGNQIQKFFEGLGKVIAFPIRLIEKLAHALGSLTGFSPGGFSKGIDGMTSALTPFQKVLEAVTRAWHRFLGLFDVSIQPQIQKIADAFIGLGPAIANAIKNMNVELILQVIRTGLFAGIFLLFKEMLGPRGFFGKGPFASQFAKALGKNFGGGIVKNIAGSFKAIEGSAVAMQRNIQSKTLLNIAIAIALLTASVVALSLVDPKRVSSSLTAMAVMFGVLLGSLKVINMLSAGTSIAKLPIIAASLIGLAIAIDILVLAVLALSRLDTGQLARGLGGIVVLLGTLTAVAVPLGKGSAGMVRAGIGITAIAVGLNIMALAVRQLGTLSLSELAKGLGGIGVALGIIVLVMQKMPLLSVFDGAGLIAIAFALNILALAVRQFGNINIKVMGKGLLGIAGALVVIAGAMQLMPLSLPITAAGLILVSIALQGVVRAVGKMGKMSVSQIAKGLITLALALNILDAALFAMTGSIGGAVALGVASAGLSLLIPALILLGHQSWGTILKSLVGLAAALTVLGIAGALIGPAVPALLGLGAAMLLIGAGMALAGAGIALVGVGLSAIAVAGPTAVAILLQALTDLTNEIPLFVKNMVLGLLEIVKTFSQVAPQFVDALVKIVSSLVEVIIKVTPRLVKAFEVILTAILKVIHDKGPDIIRAGLELLINLLKGIKDNIAVVIKTAADIVINFLKGLGSQATRIVKAGFDFISKLILGIVQGALRLVTAGAKAVIKFLNGIADVISKYEPQLIKAGVRIGAAIITGLVKGLADLIPLIKQKAEDLAHKLPHWMRKILGIHSPSRAFEDIGHNVVKGLAKGISHDKPATDASKKMATNVVTAAQDVVHQQVLAKAGQNMFKSFAKGVRGSADDVKSAFTELNSQLLESARNSRKAISAEQKTLNDLLKAKKPDQKAIEESRRIIEKNQEVLAQANAGHQALIKTLSKEKSTLLGLINDYHSVGEKLKGANQALIDAKQLRDDAFGQFSDQYGKLPDIVTTDENGKAVDQLKAYEDSLINQTNAVAAYHSTLDKLRKLGLDDQTYQKLLEDGTGDQQFADQLLKGGAKAIHGLNILDGMLKVEAGQLADTASKSLYQVGVNISQGIVDGLTAKHSALHDAIVKLANSIVVTMKSELKIKSPSAVFAEIGQFAAEGMAKGLIDSSKAVTDAIYMVSDDAMGAMQNSLTKISETVSNGIDSNPTIRPILDLTDVQKGAQSLGDMFSQQPVVASASLGQASVISRSTRKPVTQSESAITTPAGTSINFEQNNYSPEALDPVEIYRRTNNGLSQLRAIT